MNSFKMVLGTQSSDIPMDGSSDNQGYSPRTMMMLPQRTMAMSMEDAAPIASTSKMVYNSLQSSETAPLASCAMEEQASNTSHAHDQDINVPSMHNPTMQEPSISSISSSDSLSSITKGKGRAIDSSLPIEASPKQSLHPIMLPDPFSSSEMERLKVENQLLKKQLDVLAKKKFASNSSPKVSLFPIVHACDYAFSCDHSFTSSLAVRFRYQSCEQLRIRASQPNGELGIIHSR